MNIGDVAESEVRLWGERAGFVVNSASRDRMGWDHFFEMDIPSDKRRDDFFGLAQCSLSCRVQVKATSSAAPRFNIKLSNWKRAVEDPLPWFFLVLSFTPKRQSLASARLVHLGKSGVERVLHRISQLSDEEKSALHKINLPLDLNEAIELQKPFSSSLRAKITEAVGNDLFAYSKAKSAWVSNAGYTDGRAVNLQFKIRATSQDELFRKLARSAVGLDGGLEVDEMSVFRTRFGKAETLGQVGRERTQRIELSKTVDGIKLVLLDQAGGLKASLAVALRASSSVYPFLPTEHLLIRMECLMLDFLLDNGRQKLRVSIDPPDEKEQVPLKDLFASTAFLQVLRQSNDGLKLQVERHQNVMRIGSISPQIDFDALWNDRLSQIETLWKLCVNAHLENEDLRVSMQEIHSNDMKARLMSMARGLSSETITIDQKIEPRSVTEGQRVVFMTNPQIQISGIGFMDIVGLIGQAVVEGNEESTVLKLVCDKAKLLRTIRVVGPPDEGFDFDKHANELALDFEKDGDTQVLFSTWSELVR